MNQIKALIIALLIVAPAILQAGNVSLRKGEQITVSCSETAPQGGWITHAFYSLVDPEDSKYLGITYTSSDCQVTYYGLAPKSKIKVEVTYAYSYRGSYDGNIHVGHSSYYDYVTVTGAPNAKSFTIKEGDYFQIRPGQKIELHCEFNPIGSEADVEWGIIQSISTYNCVDLDVRDYGASCVITAKKKGTAYIAAMFPGDSKSAQPVTIEISKDAEIISPESIDFGIDEIALNSGESYTLSPRFSPEGSYANLIWKSDNENVAIVDNGKITAVDAGETIISSMTEDELVRAEISVVVRQKATDFSLPENVEIALGYSYKVNVSFTPKDAIDTLIWSSSDTEVISVSANGEIRAKKVGTAAITVKAKSLNINKVINVKVISPQKGLDAENVRSRVKNFKGTANRVIVNK